MNKIDNEKIFRGINYISPDLIEEAEELMNSKRKNNITWLGHVKRGAIGLAAAFMLMLGVGMAFPAFAAPIPIIGDMVMMITGREAGLVESGTLETKITNFRYYDDWRQAGIADNDMRQPPEDYEKMMEKGEQTFVLCDITIDAKELVADHRVDMSRIPADGKEEGDIVMWICNIVRPWLNDDAPDSVWQNPAFNAEIEYFSLHSSGENDYYHFAIAPDETLTAQIGFFVPTEDLNNGHVCLASDFDHNRQVYEIQYPVPPRS